MTTIFQVEKKCAVCGNSGTYAEILSTNAFGSPDLDTRPPEMERSTIDKWVQTCSLCGYCAPDISERLDNSSEVVSSDSYQQQLNNSEFPKLANAFLCFSLIQESAGKYDEAGLANVHAAWVCDDNGSDTAAQKCRLKAVTLLQKAKENGQMFAKQEGVEEAIMVDLLRRSKQFELALKICEEGLQKNPEKIISDILLFQKILISSSDTACHTIQEAIGNDK
ncbi:MAG: hypothetical protein ACPMAG_07930 [Limisphaerales bacterium]